MATRPFAYNPSQVPIDGTLQVVDLAVGSAEQEYSSNLGGVTWWMGPDEDLGYVIASPVSASTHPTPIGPIGTVKFWRTKTKTDQNFINLASYVSSKLGSPQSFLTTTEARAWLNNNGLWTSYAGIIENGLIIQLDANDTGSYPGTGTAVYDLTGSYDHTLTGATYTVLNGIKCFNCTTGTNRVVVNGTGPTLPTTGYTYITWARLEPNPSSFRTLLYTNSPKYTPITVPNGTDTLGYWDTAFRSSGYDLSGQNSVWVQYAVVGDSSSQTFYINGSQVGSPIAFGSGGRTHWGWGNNDTASQPWGYVANMYLYNRKLSIAEISEQYDFLSPRFVEPVTSNLVLYYDPSNPSSYSGSGTTINDLSGNGRNGTMSNISFTSPYFTYNGSSSQVSIADNALLEPGNGDWTMEVWVNQSVAGNDVVLGKFDPGGLALDVSYSIRTTGTTYYAQLGSGSGSGSSLFVNSTNYVGTIGSWYQIVYVFTNVAANTLQTFVNGASIGTVSHSLASILNTSSNLYLGSYNNGEYSQWFDGKIGITRLYNTALTSAQVLQNFNANRSIYEI